MPYSPTTDPVVILTACDHVTRAVRESLQPQLRLAFAETEATLYQLVASGVRLVVLHLGDKPQDAGVPGRLARVMPALSVPVVALADTTQGTGIQEVDEVLLHDVLCLRSERWTSLLRAWATQPVLARYLVQELRILHGAAPSELFPALEELCLAPDLLLSVKAWSAELGVSRTRLHRDIARAGFSPSVLVDAARSLHAVGPYLVRRNVRRRESRAWSALRTERRVLSRTLGLTCSDLTEAESQGTSAIRRLVTSRLRKFFDDSRIEDATLLADTAGVGYMDIAG